MPKIPLYNQGQGPTVELATGQLGPRAPSGVFEAPGRALADLASTASDVAFNFGMAERSREDDRIARETYTEAHDAVTSFVRDDKSTSVAEVDKAFDVIQKDILGRVDAKGYSSRRADVVKKSLNDVFIRGRFDAKNQAHNRGMLQAQIAFDENVIRSLDVLRTATPGTPQYEFTRDALVEGLSNHLSAGFSSSYSQASLASQIEGIRTDGVRSSYSQSIGSAGTDAKLDELESGISDLNLSAPDKDVLRGQISRRRTELEQELVADFVGYIPIANIGDTDFNTIEAVEFLIASAKNGDFGERTDLAEKWATLGSEERNKIEAAWSARLSEARNSVSFNERQRDRQEKEANETIFTDNKARILSGDLSIAAVDELGFTGAQGEIYRDQLKNLIGRRARGELITDSSAPAYRETRDRVYTGEITDITQRFVLPSDPPDIRSANNGAGLSILERSGTNLSDPDVAGFERYITATKRAAASDEDSQYVRNSQLFQKFVAGYKDIIIGNPAFAKLSLQSGARYYDFTVQMEQRFLQGVAEGKDPRSLLNPRSDDFIIRSNENWTPSQAELMGEIAASLAEQTTVADEAAAQEFAPPARPAGMSIQDYMNSDDYQQWATGPNAPRYYKLLGIQ